MGVQFADKCFKHNDTIALVLRKPITHESDKVAELAEEECYETLGLSLQEKCSSSAQDLATSDVPKELEVDKVECNFHQGDEIGASDVG